MENVIQLHYGKAAEDIFSPFRGVRGFRLWFGVAVSHQNIVPYMDRQAFRQTPRDLFRLIKTTFVPPLAGKGYGDKEESVGIHLYVREIAREEIGERFCRTPRNFNWWIRSLSTVLS
jgi:hypothetical protein